MKNISVFVTFVTLFFPLLVTAQILPVDLSELELDSDLSGFVIKGAAISDRAGYAVSGAGDMNGDGLDDVIVGAPISITSNYSGRSYVVFGRTGGSQIELSEIEIGSPNGFMINGVDYQDNSGRSLGSVGDFNGDGLSDVILGAYRADPNGNNSGTSYVVFGKTNTDALELSDLEAGLAGGFAIHGSQANDYSGWAVAGAGDVNGDGFADVIVGAYQADPNGNNSSGASYVIFGESNPEQLQLSQLETNGRGFLINGANKGDGSGYSVSSAGDINGDGLDDLLIGARRADPNGDDTGATYVVFGKSTTETVELADLDSETGEGFVINGSEVDSYSGSVVRSAGDANGDGLSDILIGVSQATLGGDDEGASYIIFGKTSFSAVELSQIESGNGGFVIDGTDIDGRAGWSVDGAGDVNGDGLSDVIIGAYVADISHGNAGSSFVIYGKSTTEQVKLSSLSTGGSGGFAIHGANQSDSSGRYVSAAGDVNGDGLADLIVAASDADPNGDSSGAAYVIYGRLDIDGDGATDDWDAFPNDPEESLDLDDDGLGDFANPPDVHAYHFLDSIHDGDTPQIYANVNETILLSEGQIYRADSGGLIDIGSVYQGQVIYSNYPLSIGSDKNGTDMPVPVEFSGTDFAVPLYGGDEHSIFVKNITENTVSFNYYPGGGSTNSETIQPGEVIELYSDRNNRNAKIWQASGDLLVSHRMILDDEVSYLAPPANYEIYGMQTMHGRVGALENDTQITVHSSDGRTYMETINSSLLFTLEYEGHPWNYQDGDGPFVKISSDKPIGAIQNDDSDGYEGTSFWPSTMFAGRYVLPTETDYIAIGCIDTRVDIEIYSPERDLLQTHRCNANGDFPGKVRIKNEFNSGRFDQGTYVESEKPVFLIYDPKEDDEQNLTGAVPFLQTIADTELEDGVFYFPDIEGIDSFQINAFEEDPGSGNLLPTNVYTTNSLSWSVLDLGERDYWVSITACDSNQICSGGSLELFVDSDGDTMPDPWELINGLNHLESGDAQMDHDDDGLTNLEEYLLGTEPNQPPSDILPQLVNTLVPEQGELNDYFGYDIDVDGSIAVVGAYGYGNNWLGTAYVFVLNEEGEWEQQAKLLGQEEGGYFGFSVAISGTLIAVGARGEDGNAPDSGVVYLFERVNGSEWKRTAKIFASDGAAEDKFGTYGGLDLDGDTLVVGAFSHDTVANSTGAAYVFERNIQNQWVEIQKLSPSTVSAAGFGHSVSLDEDQLLVGAYGDDTNHATGAGSAYIYKRDSSGIWQLGQKLSVDEGLDNDQFGYAVSLKGNIAVVGAPSRDELSLNGGAAYAFVKKADDQWHYDQKWLSPEVLLSGEDRLGTGVEVDQRRVAFTSAGRTDQYNGAAHIYALQTDGTWQSQALLASNISDDPFALSFDGDSLFVGHPSADNTGLVYAYDLDGWGEDDNCPDVANIDQADFDGDGFGDMCDIFPADDSEHSDLDRDGIGDGTDLDIDGDGFNNDNDFLPLNPREWNDHDNDGTGDNEDTDDDNDGMSDIWELDNEGFDPLDPSDADADFDDDGYTNLYEYWEEWDPNEADTVPERPTVTVNQLSNTSFEVSITHTEPGVIFSSEHRTPNGKENLGEDSSYILSGLEPGRHYVRVRAENHVGEGAPRSSDSIYVLDLPINPEFLGQLNGIDDNWLFHWDAAEDAQTYLVEERINGGDWIEVQNHSGFAYIIGLGADLDGFHEYRVRACREFCGEPTQVLSLDFLGNYSEFSISGPSQSIDGNYELSLGAPADVSANLDYRLYEQLPGESNFSTTYISRNLSNDSPPFTVPYLEKEEGTYVYKILVCLINTNQCSEESSHFSVIVNYLPEGPVTQHFLYDSLGRLEFFNSETEQQGLSYLEFGYDETGNRDALDPGHPQPGDPDQDNDGDSVLNGCERLLGFNPLDANDVPGSNDVAGCL